MGKRGGQIGNRNAVRGRPWSAAIERALNAHGADKRMLLDAAAEALVAKAVEGDIAALKEIGDRLEGKPTQSIESNIEITAHLEERMQAARRRVLEYRTRTIEGTAEGNNAPPIPQDAAEPQGDLEGAFAITTIEPCQ